MTPEQRLRELQIEQSKLEREIESQEREDRYRAWIAAGEHEDTAALRSAMKEFSAVRDKHSKLGACDSEPRYHYHQAIQDAAHKNTVKIPTSGRGWELFSGMRGVGQAAKELSAAARKVVKEVKAGLGNDNVERYIAGFYS